MAFGLFKKKEESKSNQSDGFLHLKIKEVVHETADAISIHFEQPGTEQVEYKAGQFFTIIANINGKEERRAYSVCSSPYVDTHPAVTVKRVEGGLMSNYLNDGLNAGDTLKVMPPIGNFTTEFSSDNSRELILFGGGSGITPLMSIAKSALDQEPNTKVTLVYANRDINSIIFKDTLEKLESNDRFSVLHILEKEGEGYATHTGYLSQEIINAVLEESDRSKVECFICGPTPMMDIAINGLQTAGIPADKVYKESFVSTASDTSLETDEIIAREVTIIYDDEEYKYIVEPGETILEKGLDEDIDLPFSCQSGLCTACRGKCVSGKVKMDEDEGLSEAEIEEGYVLPCVGHPLTDDVVIEIG